MELGATLIIGVLTTHHCHNGLLPLLVAPFQDAELPGPIQVPFRFAPATGRKETVVIGYAESCQLDVEPAKYFVLVTKREKRACRSCEDLGVVSAPLPPRIIEKCLASDRIVIETVIGKYCNHTPLQMMAENPTWGCSPDSWRTRDAGVRNLGA